MENNLERVESLDSSRPSREIIQNKIKEFLKWKEEESLGDYQKVIDRFRGFMNVEDRDMITKKMYKGWAKEDFEEVLRAVELSDRDNEILKITTQLEGLVLKGKRLWNNFLNKK